MKRPLLAVLLVAACARTPAPAPTPPTAADAPTQPAAPAPTTPPPTSPTAQTPSVAPSPPTPPEVPAVKEANLYSLSANSLGGPAADLSQYKGKVALVVNVASECGYTPQYEGLEKLWREYKDRGLVVLGFPSNEFGGQEPGDAAQIQAFCKKNYGVTFPLFDKIVTGKGEKQSPVYEYLTRTTGEQPNWNFCKYLVAKNGDVVKFWRSKTTPESAELRGAIDAALAAK